MNWTHRAPRVDEVGWYLQRNKSGGAPAYNTPIRAVEIRPDGEIVGSGIGCRYKPRDFQGFEWIGPLDLGE